MAAGLTAKAIDLAQAEAGALADFLGGEERIEGARAASQRSMPTPVSITAIITYSPGSTRSGERGDVVRHRDCGSRSRSISLPPSRHGVAGVERQIDEGVLELVRIDEGAPESVREHGLQRDRLAERPLQQIADSADERVGVHRLRRERLPGARRRAGGRSAPRARWTPCSAMSLARSIRALAGEAVNWTSCRSIVSSPPSISVSMIVEIVRDAAGELAQRLHLLRLAQLLLEPAPLASRRAR